MRSFGDRLIERLRSLRHPVSVGLNPYLDHNPRLFRGGMMLPGDPETPGVIEEVCRSGIDLVANDIAIVKPQAALFERAGSAGWAALEQVVRYGRASNLLVLLDAKRGGIPDTANAYAQSYPATDASGPVDARTVNPYMGPDSVRPFMAVAGAPDRGNHRMVIARRDGRGNACA